MTEEKKEEKKIDESWKEKAKEDLIKDVPAEPSAKKEGILADEAGESQTGEDMPLPELDFKLFVYSLTMQALMHLGDIPNPVTKKAEVNLNQAKQTIDILGILEEKTRGNLDADEKRMLEGALFDLRMRFVEKGKPN